MVEGFRFHEVQEKGRLVLVEYASKEKNGQMRSAKHADSADCSVMMMALCSDNPGRLGK